MSQSDLVPVAIVAGWRRDLLLLLLTGTHNERGLSVDHGGGADCRELRAQSSGGDAAGAWRVKRRHAL